MISPLQILLARTMLGKSQQDVAKDNGMAHQTLSKIEKGIIDTPSSRLKELEGYFENHGIEFTINDGIKKRGLSFKRYKGDEQFREFFDDIYNVAGEEGGEIVLFNGVPQKLLHHLGEDWYKRHAERMSKIADKLDFKIIIKEGDMNYIANTFAEYRWFPKMLFNEKTIYVYGNNTAFIYFGEDVRVLSVNEPEIAESFRILFNIAWDNVAVKPGG